MPAPCHSQDPAGIFLHRKVFSEPDRSQLLAVAMRETQWEFLVSRDQPQQPIRAEIFPRADSDQDGKVVCQPQIDCSGRRLTLRGHIATSPPTRRSDGATRSDPTVKLAEAWRVMSNPVNQEATGASG